MRNFGYYVAVAFVVFLLVWVGSVAHSNREQEQIAAKINRGDAPAAGLAKNFDLKEIERIQVAQGIYPPRALGLVAQRRPPSNSWLLDADNDRERFRRIEVVFRGLDVHMAEIGLRFDKMHEAIERGNLPLATLEADNTIETAQIAMLKRPGFGDEEALRYMGAPAWVNLMEALEANDQARSRAAFLEVRQSCIACHAARDLAFINDSKLFDTTATFSGAAQTTVASTTPSSVKNK